MKSQEWRNQSATRDLERQEVVTNGQKILLRNIC